MSVDRVKPGRRHKGPDYVTINKRKHSPKLQNTPKSDHVLHQSKSIENKTLKQHLNGITTNSQRTKIARRHTKTKL